MSTPATVRQDIAARMQVIVRKAGVQIGLAVRHCYMCAEDVFLVSDPTPQAISMPFTVDVRHDDAVVAVASIFENVEQGKTLNLRIRRTKQETAP